jgi:hypothetical protein
MRHLELDPEDHEYLTSARYWQRHYFGDGDALPLQGESYEHLDAAIEEALMFVRAAANQTRTAKIEERHLAHHELLYPAAHPVGTIMWLGHESLVGPTGYGGIDMRRDNPGEPLSPPLVRDNIHAWMTAHFAGAIYTFGVYIGVVLPGLRKPHMVVLPPPQISLDEAFTYGEDDNRQYLMRLNRTQHLIHSETESEGLFRFTDGYVWNRD